MSKKYAWTDHLDDEIWHGGPCDSIQECVREACEGCYSREGTFAIGYIEPYEINYDFADLITEHLSNDAYEEVGEVAEEWLYKVPKEDMERLNNRVTAIVKDWLKEIREEPTFYKVYPLQECTIQEALKLHEEKVKTITRGGKTEN
jgi:hypothetical protein